MKIAISGAGIAGPTLAFWLRRSGHEPTLIEKAPEFRTGGYVIDFWGVGYSVAERMGLLPAIREAGYQVEEVRLVGEDGARIGDFPADVFRRLTGDRFTSLQRGALAAEVFKAIDGKVETVFGDSITALHEHETGIRAEFAKGKARDFDLVVGADGLHSSVRSLVFGPEDTFEKPLGYHVAAFRIDGYLPRDELAYVSFSRPGRQAARFALRSGETLIMLVFASELAEGHAARTTQEQKTLLHHVFDGAGWECEDILEGMDELQEIYFDRVSQIRMPRWSQGRVALIGDAAACVSLLAGEGTGLAMTEAYVLAGELSRAESHETAFARYEERLRPFLEGKQKAAASFAGSFAPKTAAGLFLRNQATKLLRLPVFADLLLGGTVRDDFELPDYGI